jgi:hypothetical protein
MATDNQVKARKKNFLKLIQHGSIKLQMNGNLTQREQFLLKVVQSAAAAASAENDGVNEIWTTGNNSIIALGDIGSDHLSNIISFIERGGMVNKELQYELFWKFMMIGEQVRRKHNK